MNFIRKSLWALFAFLALGCQTTQATENEEGEKCYVSQLPAELTHGILEESVMLDRLQNKSFEEVCKNLSLVCKDWHATIKENAKRWVCEYFNIGEKNKDDFWRFFKDTLIYKPNPDNDVGRINLFISALPNPLEGTFNLSNCDDAGRYLSINTGYRKGKKEENAIKVEIWVAPRFLIERELSTTAAHFQPIMDNWKQEQAPVGLFWTWGGGWAADDHDMDYLTTENTDNLSKIDLYENWKKSAPSGLRGRWYSGGVSRTRAHGKFHVSFVN
ncbi:hypothetical protein IM40_03570 [Candidatus Paracaedimonas acanthamoebae]|nr:hypothetical protein IM40_03570 [Candidatus Paracaedimonas acanthamoebae]